MFNYKCILFAIYIFIQISFNYFFVCLRALFIWWLVSFHKSFLFRILYQFFIVYVYTYRDRFTPQLVHLHPTYKFTQTYLSYAYQMCP